MPNADKCYLNIPFKEYLKQLKVDGDGKIRQKDLDKVAAQEFENYKAIERRVNDPVCGGIECGCSWVFAQGNTDDGGNIALSAEVFSSKELAFYGPPLEQAGGWTITGGGGAGELVPPDPTGLYHIDMLVSFTQSSGTDPVLVSAQVLDTMTTWVAPTAYYPAGGGTVSVIASRLVSLASPFACSAIIESASGAAATRSLGVYVEIYAYPLCGCVAPDNG